MAVMHAASGEPQVEQDAATSIWPRRRSTLATLVALLSVQVTVFLSATARSFFTHEDFYNFALAEDRSVLRYLITPIIHTYPLPGQRFLFLVLRQFFPMNYLAARLLLLGILAGTTILLAQLVRELSRSDRWWTAALLTPFALSLTLVSPVNLWSNGVPFLPALFLTVMALAAWLKSFTGPKRNVWFGVTLVAETAAGAFSMRFLLIPMYLFFFRVALFPALLNLPVSWSRLWSERMRWLALAVPPILFVSVYVVSGLAERSNIPGERPYLAYLVTAWFRVFVPVAMLNVPTHESPISAGAAALPSSGIGVVASHAVFLALLIATVRRSAVAWRAWALVVLAFLTNLLMVGAVRLPGFGINVAYWLRYYPEVVLFVPMTLALCLRQGAERHRRSAWERTAAGQIAIGAFACAQAVSFAVWAPAIVSGSDGAMARRWVDRLHGGLAAVKAKTAPRIIDSETPEYIVLSWMAPYNRVSTVLGLLRIDAVYNDLSGPAYFVAQDGTLTRAAFTSGLELIPGQAAQLNPGTSARCVDQGQPMEYRPSPPLAGERLVLRIDYRPPAQQPSALQVETDDAERRYRDLELRPFRSEEIIDLGAPRVLGLKLTPSPGDRVCIARMQIGSLHADGTHHPLDR